MEVLGVGGEVWEVREVLEWEEVKGVAGMLPRGGEGRKAEVRERDEGAVAGGGAAGPG